MSGQFFGWLYGRQCRGQTSSLFFFFQAEDGIRDVAVTGVQTCALPIFAESSRAAVMVHPNTGNNTSPSSIATADTREEISTAISASADTWREKSTMAP